MFKFQLPMFRGADLFPNVMYAPTAVRMNVVVPDQLAESQQQEAATEAMRIVDFNRPALMQAYSGLRQRHDLSGNDYMKVSRPFPGCDMSLSINFGQEILTLNVYPQVTFRTLGEEVSEDEDIYRDCYILFCNVNRVRDDNLQVTLNGEVLGVMDFTAEGDATAYLFKFGENALRAHSKADDNNPNKLYNKLAPKPKYLPTYFPYGEMRATDFETGEPLRPVIAEEYEFPLELMRFDEPNTLTLRAVQDNEFSTYGEFAIEAFEPDKMDYVSVSYRRTAANGRLRTEATPRIFYGAYSPTLSPSGSGVSAVTFTFDFKTGESSDDSDEAAGYIEMLDNDEPPS